jgi:methionine-rich copper-binding protein CopC
MRKLGAAFILVMIATLGVAPAVAAAQAPPAYVSSEPSRDEEVHEAPATVTIDFDQPLDPSSFIEIEDHCGRRVDDGNTSVTGNQMEVALSKKPAGMYHVTYFAKGIAGVTGQSTGIFMFTAHAGPSCGEGAAHHHHNGNTGNHSGHGRHSGHQGSGHTGHEAAGHHAAGHGGLHSAAGHHQHSGTGDHEGHGAEGHEGEHSGHAGHTTEPNIRNIFASDNGGPSLRVDRAAVLLSLGLSALLGLLGGWILRLSSVRPGT